MNSFCRLKSPQNSPKIIAKKHSWNRQDLEKYLMSRSYKKIQTEIHDKIKCKWRNPSVLSNNFPTLVRLSLEPRPQLWAQFWPRLLRLLNRPHLDHLQVEVPCSNPGHPHIHDVRNLHFEVRVNLLGHRLFRSKIFYKKLFENHCPVWSFGFLVDLTKVSFHL